MTTRQRWTLAAAVLGSSIVFLDTTIVTIALPRIGRDLPSSVVAVLEGQSYVYNAYLLSLSSLLILAGALTDYYGRRRVFMLGLVGFGITSVACGLAPTMEILILCRVAQGAAGALLVPASLSIITATFEGPERARAVGIWAAASAAVTILGPVIGGILVDAVSWRAAFFVNVPLVLGGLWAARRHMAETWDAGASGRFDWLGAVVIAVAVGGLSFGIIRGEEHGWTDPIVVASLVAGLAAAGMFPIRMIRSDHPLVPPWLFRSRNFTVTNLSTFVIYGALYVTSYNQGLFLQGTLRYTALGAGLAGLASSVLLALLSAPIGALAGRHGPRAFMTVGPFTMALGILWLARVPASSAPWPATIGDPASLVPPPDYVIDVLPGVALYGLGLAILVAPLTSALLNSVPVANSGLASAINNAISRVGPQLVGAIMFVAITATFYVGLADRVPGLDPDDPALRRSVAPLNRPPEGLAPSELVAIREASTDAFHLAMLVSSVLLASGAAINGLGIRNAQSTPSEAELISPVA